MFITIHQMTLKIVWINSRRTGLLRAISLDDLMGPLGWGRMDLNITLQKDMSTIV